MKRFATGLLLSAVTLACQEPAEPPSGPVASVIDTGVGADVAAALDASVVHLPGAGERPEDAALSCEVLAQEHPELASDAYWLNPVGGSTDNAFLAYCDLDADDGPWTLILKVDGHETTFKYDEAIWYNSVLLNEDEVAPGPGQMKNAGYLQLPFTYLRVGLRVDEDAEEGDGTTRYLTLRHEASSMRQLMVRGDEHLTELGRDRWRSLIPLTSLQPNCNAEGINVRHRLRFGILGNEQNDCHTPDSFIGIGSDRDQVITGNFAVGRWQSDNGDRRTKAYGEIWVKNAAALERVLP